MLHLCFYQKSVQKYFFFMIYQNIFAFFVKKVTKSVCVASEVMAPTAIFEFQMDRNQSYFRLRRNLPNKTLVLLLRED